MSLPLDSWFSLVVQCSSARCRTGAGICALLFGLSGQVFAQTANPLSPPRLAPVAPLSSPNLGLTPVAPGARLALPGINITRWGIAERQGAKTHGKTGETLFIEGRDLDPARLGVEIRAGAKSVRFVRKAGGSSARVEFTIPPEAVTGDMLVQLQAVGQGTQLLSEQFGVCDRVRVNSIQGSPLGYELRQRDANGQIILDGKILTLRGECLHELKFLQVQGMDAIAVGPATLLIKELLAPTTYQQVQVKLTRLILPAGGGFRAAGPIRLQLPDRGPNMVIDEDFALARAASAATPPSAPAPMVPIRISAVESNSRWGAASLPFVILSPAGVHSFVFDRQIKLTGENLLSNPGTQWFIGTVPLAQPNINNMIALPDNAVSGTVCAQRSDGVRACAPGTTTVLAAPKLTGAPAGFPLLGTLDSAQVVAIPVRQKLRLTGFDLKPPPGLGIEAVLSVSNFDRTVAARCDYDLQVHRFDNSTLEFSFGTPGGARPAACSEAQENSFSFLRSPGATAELKLQWLYQGDAATAKAYQWFVRGTR